MTDNDDDFRPIKRMKLFFHRGCAHLNNLYSDRITTGNDDNEIESVINDNVQPDDETLDHAKSDVNETYALVEDVGVGGYANNRFDQDRNGGMVSDQQKIQEEECVVSNAGNNDPLLVDDVSLEIICNGPRKKSDGTMAGNDTGSLVDDVSLPVISNKPKETETVDAIKSHLDDKDTDVEMIPSVPKADPPFDNSALESEHNVGDGGIFDDASIESNVDKPAAETTGKLGNINNNNDESYHNDMINRVPPNIAEETNDVAVNNNQQGDAHPPEELPIPLDPQVPLVDNPRDGHPPEDSTDDESVGYPPVESEEEDSVGSLPILDESDDESDAVAVEVEAAPPFRRYINSFTVTQKEVNFTLKLNVSVKFRITFDKNVFHGAALLVDLLGHKMNQRQERKHFANCTDMTRLRARTIREKYNQILKQYGYHLEPQLNRWEYVFPDATPQEIVVVVFSVQVCTTEDHMRQVAIYDSKSYVLLPVMYHGKSLLIGSRLRVAAAQADDSTKRQKILDTIKRHLFHTYVDFQLSAVYKVTQD